MDKDAKLVPLYQFDQGVEGARELKKGVGRDLECDRVGGAKAGVIMTDDTNGVRGH